MPFTLSHVAAVVPAYRPLTRAHLYSAAVIGSMAPDFGVLMPEALARWQTHSVQALFSFCLPSGLLVWWLTQWLVKPAVIELLPDGAWARARAEHPPLRLSDLRCWLGAAAGVLLGAVTHLVWDAFTHGDGRGVRLFSQLDEYGPGFGGHLLRVYGWLQYGSSVLGLAVVALALALWLHHAPAPAAPPVRRLGRRERSLWLLLYALVPLLAVAWGFGRQFGAGHPRWLSTQAIGREAAWLLRGGAVALIGVSAALQARLAARASGGGTLAPAPRGPAP
jgi:hypothetical protein